MQVVELSSCVWQIRPGAQDTIGVVVGMHVEVVAPPAVVVIHQVVDICEVVRQTRGEVVDPVADVEVVVEVIVVSVEVVDEL